MLYENFIKMKRSNREQYYQNRSIAELKREAQNRHLIIPQPVTKNYLIYILLNSENQQNRPVNNYSNSNNASDDNLTPNNDNHRHQHHQHHHSNIPRTSPSYSPSPAPPANTASNRSNKKEKKREYSPVLPKNTQNQKNKKAKENKKKENFFNFQAIKDMFPITDADGFNDIINYCVLICLLYYGIFNQIFLILFSVFLVDLISTNHIRIKSIQQNTKNKIKFVLTWIYLLICALFPFEALAAFISFYISKKVYFGNIQNIDLLLLIFYFSVLHFIGISILVFFMFKQHLRNTNSRFIERLFNIY